MRSFLGAVVAATGLLCTTAFAQSYEDVISGLVSPCNESRITIESQSDIAIYSNRTSLNESALFVGHTFTGHFEVPNVRSLGRFRADYLGPSIEGLDRVDDQVTEFSMPDLEETTLECLGSLVFGYLPHLTAVSFPKLTTVVGQIVIYGNDGLKTLSLPSLKNVTGGVWIGGRFDSIELPALRNVAYLKIESTGNLDCPALGANLTAAGLTFSPEDDDLFIGFTCSTMYPENSYHSHDGIDMAKSSATGIVINLLRVSLTSVAVALLGRLMV
ncbi:GPI-anchored cell wall organization protein ecm33 [Phlyctema vagabunda]|uniref:GPI-anchored cell wall organization protein ecm33 n=1 Tax=Phlyctema vagabunda TaxID=108571 RepID=A0ABR4PZ83_9HELO